LIVTPSTGLPLLSVTVPFIVSVDCAITLNGRNKIQTSRKASPGKNLKLSNLILLDLWFGYKRKDVKNFKQAV
jgi:hypothetical protein